MVHGFATLCFALIATGATLLIWTMLAGNRAAIVAALGLTPVVPACQVASRRIRVRSAQPVSVIQARTRRVA